MISCWPVFSLNLFSVFVLISHKITFLLLPKCLPISLIFYPSLFSAASPAFHFLISLSLSHTLLSFNFIQLFCFYLFPPFPFIAKLRPHLFGTLLSFTLDYLSLTFQQTNLANFLCLRLSKLLPIHQSQNVSHLASLSYPINHSLTRIIFLFTAISFSSDLHFQTRTLTL